MEVVEALIKAAAQLQGDVMNLKVNKYFPYDNNTLWIIREMETMLGLKNKDCEEMGYTELIEYINKITFRSFKSEKNINN